MFKEKIVNANGLQVSTGMNVSNWTNQQLIERIISKMGRSVNMATQPEDFGNVFIGGEYVDGRYLSKARNKCCNMLEEVGYFLDNLKLKEHIIVDSVDEETGEVDWSGDIRHYYACPICKEVYDQDEVTSRSWYHEYKMDNEILDGDEEFHENACVGFKEEVNHDDGSYEEGTISAQDAEICAYEPHTHLKHFKVFKNVAGACRIGKGREYIEKHIHELEEDNINIERLLEIADSMNEKGWSMIRGYFVKAKEEMPLNWPLLNKSNTRDMSGYYSASIVPPKSMPSTGIVHEYKEWFNGKRQEFANLKVRKVASWKYKDKSMVILSFMYEGNLVTLKKLEGATNWLNPNKLSHENLNKAIDWARKEFKEKKMSM